MVKFYYKELLQRTNVTRINAPINKFLSLELPHTAICLHIQVCPVSFVSTVSYALYKLTPDQYQMYGNSCRYILGYLLKLRNWRNVSSCVQSFLNLL
jgi:hypothetical protein